MSEIIKHGRDDIWDLEIDSYKDVFLHDFFEDTVLPTITRLLTFLLARKRLTASKKRFIERTYANLISLTILTI